MPMPSCRWHRDTEFSAAGLYGEPVAVMMKNMEEMG